MATIYDVDANELIEKAAIELNKNENIKAPEWASFVKTGVHKERVPARDDWWYIRAAAVLRTVYKYGPIGVSKLRVKYGGKKRRGHQPSKFMPGSGNIIRKVLQQLEKAGYLKKEDKSIHKGRVLTKEGRSFLDKLATGMYKGSSANKPKKVEEPKEDKKEIPKSDDKPKEPSVKEEAKPKVEEKKEEPKAKEQPKPEAKKEEQPKKEDNQ